MIELGKQYRTRDGREVRIYAVDGGGRFPVHGAVKLNDGTWRQEEWTLTGSYNGESSHGHTIAHHLAYNGESSHGHTIAHRLDLIEVKPRIQREVWVNVYPNGTSRSFEEKRFADEYAMDHRIACVKLVIDCEGGEGL
jgi:hypothetical protein